MSNIRRAKSEPITKITNELEQQLEKSNQDSKLVQTNLIGEEMPEDYKFDYDGENFSMRLHGKELIGCQWLPPSERPKFLILFFHGLGAFLAINRPFFPTILANGGAVFGTDHFGHGRSPGERGYVTGDDLFDEIRLLIKRAKSVFPDVPLFIYGHSLGGLTVLSFICSFPHECDAFDGVIIEAPWLHETPQAEKSIPIKIVGLIGKYLFRDVQILTCDGYDYNQYPHKFIDNIVKSNLSHDYVTPLLYASAVQMRKAVLKKYTDWPKNLPLLFMQGGQDSSVGIDNNLKWAEMMREMRPNYVQIAYHPKAQHAMLRNVEGNLILYEMIDFITSLLSPITKNS